MENERPTGTRNEAAAVFGDVLRRRRKALGLTQEALSEAAGLSSKFVAHLERAERQPSLWSMLRLARALGVPAAGLVAEVEQTIQNASGRDGP